MLTFDHLICTLRIEKEYLLRQFNQNLFGSFKQKQVNIYPIKPSFDVKFLFEGK